MSGEEDRGEILKFVPLQSSVNEGFWHTLSSLKLNKFGLDEPPIQITGYYVVATGTSALYLAPFTTRIRWRAFMPLISKVCCKERQKKDAPAPAPANLCCTLLFCHPC